MKKGAAYEDVLREISIMKKICHKNVIQLFEVINDPDNDHIYMSKSIEISSDIENLNEFFSYRIC